MLDHDFWNYIFSHITLLDKVHIDGSYGSKTVAGVISEYLQCDAIRWNSWKVVTFRVAITSELMISF